MSQSESESESGTGLVDGDRVARDISSRRTRERIELPVLREKTSPGMLCMISLISLTSTEKFAEFERTVELVVEELLFWKFGLLQWRVDGECVHGSSSQNS